jgi:hypothetical protein
LPWKTDVEPLTEEVININNIDKVYWKGDFIVSRTLGPNSYFVKGFLVISNEESLRISKKYDFWETNVSFPKGMNPNVTKCKTFKWTTKSDFSIENICLGWLETLYLDKNNGVIFFDIERN